MLILLVEDHQRLAQTIVDGLAGFGFPVDLFGTADEGLAAMQRISYDAMILDLGLPDRDGIEVVREIRAMGKRVPILILTARDGVDDRVEGLDSGADAYLLKPFATKELAARLRALLRRPEGPLSPLSTRIDIGNISLNTTTRQIEVDGRVVSISRRELDALELLMRRADQVVPKRVFEESVYGFSDEVAPNAIEALVSRLRRRLEKVEARVSIHTLRGIGYLLKEK
jgi:DNA-binding response OmpR family regulator